ncbi:MAG: sugar phosphate isomerase/epimerase family protein [Acetatifactor sp.]
MIRIGTCVKGEELIKVLPGVIASGFESVEIYFDSGLKNMDLAQLAYQAKEIIRDSGVEFSGIGIYVNPLQEDNSRKEIEECIDKAKLFGAKVVSTFAGAIENAPVFAAIPRFKDVFGELTKRAEANGIRIGIENAHMNGFWYGAKCNIGYCPGAWELMFEAVPSSTLGLTWEPSHQLEQFIDIYEQLEVWLPRVVHVHGKDAKLDKEFIAKYGAWFGQHYCDHKFPGLGDSDWRKIVSILRKGNYQGTIDIEGFHDPEFQGEREMEGQKMALDYLKRCREES